MVELYFLLSEAPIIRNMSMMFSAFLFMISLSVSLKPWNSYLLPPPTGTWEEKGDWVGVFSEENQHLMRK